MGNKILSYTSKDYDSIRTDLINAIPGLTDIWTSRDQADPGMVLVTLMSALGDNLSFNIDTQSLEFFGKTVTQRKNAQAIFDLLGYKMHWYKSAKLEVTVTNSNPTTDLWIPLSISNQTVARLSSTTSSSTPPYILLPNDPFNPGSWDNPNAGISITPNTSAKFTAIQGALNSISFSSNDVEANNRYYLSQSKLDQDHIWLKMSNYSSVSGSAMYWKLVDNINELDSDIPAFEFNVDEHNLPYIEFVPHWRKSYIDEGTDVKFTMYYIATSGANGNVTSNILNFIPNATVPAGHKMKSSEIHIMHGTNAYATDNLNNCPGKGPETAREAYVATKKIIGTYNTLVTVKDFERFFKRLGNISNTLCIDGQRARDLNKNIKEVYNKVVFGNSLAVTKLPETDTNSDTIYALVEDQVSSSGLIEYKAGSYINRAKSWQTFDVIVSESSSTPKVDHPDENKKYASIFIKNNNVSAKGLYMYINNGWIKLGDIAVVNEIPAESDGFYYILCEDPTDLSTYDNKVYYYNNNTYWEKLEDYDENGYKPYMAEMHLVVNNFLETDPLKSEITYASSKPVVVENIDNKDYGFMKYTPSHLIIGNDEDSEVNQSGVLDYKLISADLEYGSVRKFPYFIDGKIHLKEPVSPQNANAILKSVYNALFLSFASGGLTFGKKIDFSDIIYIINAASNSINYFDAGMNNEHGSLFIYPNENDLNPYDVDNVGEIQTYGINIDPKYFNPLSLQHYEDILFPNNAYIYWCETSSGHLTIAEDSIAYKQTPNLDIVNPNATLIKTGDTVTGINLQGLSLVKDGNMTQSLRQVRDNYFEFALVKEITIDLDLTQTEDPFASGVHNVIYYNQNGKIWHSVTEELTNLVTEGDINDKTNLRYKDPGYNPSLPESPDNVKYITNTDGFVIAYRMRETLSTNETEPKFVFVNFLQDDEVN